MVAITKHELAEGLKVVTAANQFIESHRNDLIELGVECRDLTIQHLEKLLGWSIITHVDKYRSHSIRELGYSTHLGADVCCEYGCIVVRFCDRDDEQSWHVVITEDLLTRCDYVAKEIAQRLYDDVVNKMTVVKEQQIDKVKRLREEADRLEKELNGESK